MRDIGAATLAGDGAPRRLAHLPVLDGLRGAAVAVVVAFHAHWLTGGYLGVDVFFVLSGFLITRLLVDEHDRTGRIDLVNFWRRRARRLLPAMLVVVCVAAVVERVRERLDGPAGGRLDVVGALTYSSNWLRLDSGAGYWRQFGGPSLLDHTWSLAIEEQFYVVWPLLVLALFALVRSTLGRVMVLGAASCVAALWALRMFDVTGDASRVYMGTDTRAVALLLGATVALASRLPTRWGRRAQRVAALPALIGLTVLIVRLRGDALATYRGGLLACSLAGAVLVYAAATERPAPALRPFTSAPLRWLGTRSYGIYLWHWPIMVGFGVAHAPTSSTLARLASIAVSLGIAEVSYRVIEQPIRHQGLMALRSVPRGIGTVVATVAISLGAVFAPVTAATSGAVPLPTATTTQIAQVTTLPSMSLVPQVTLPGDRPPRVMVVGDSVGWYLGLQGTKEQERLGVEFINEASPECPLTDAPMQRRRDASSVPLVFPPRCADIVLAYRDTVARVQPDVVLMVFGASLFDENEIAPGEWHAPCTAALDSWFQDQIRRSADALSSTGATVYWVTQAYYRAQPTDRFDEQTDCENARAREVVEQSNGEMGLLDLGAWACPTRDCLTERDGYELRHDGSHFVDQGASLANIWLLGQVFDRPPWDPSSP